MESNVLLRKKYYEEELNEKWMCEVVKTLPLCQSVPYSYSNLPPNAAPSLNTFIANQREGLCQNDQLSTKFLKGGSENWVYFQPIIMSTIPNLSNELPLQNGSLLSPVQNNFGNTLWRTSKLSSEEEYSIFLEKSKGMKSRLEYICLPISLPLISNLVHKSIWV